MHILFAFVLYRFIEDCSLSILYGMCLHYIRCTHTRLIALLRITNMLLCMTYIILHLHPRQSDTNKEQPPGPAAQDMLPANLMFSAVTLCNSLRRSKHSQYYVRTYKGGVRGEGRKWRHEKLHNLYHYLNRLRSVLEIRSIWWAHDEIINRLKILVKKLNSVELASWGGLNSVELASWGGLNSVELASWGGLNSVELLRFLRRTQFCGVSFLRRTQFCGVT
jgi:hypothetical protein